MGVILMSSIGCMDLLDRVCRHTRRENSAQLYRYPAQKSMYKSTPSSVIIASPYVRPSPTLARAQHATFPHDDIADSIFPIGVCYLLGLGSTRAHRIGRRRFLFGKPQAQCRLGEVINIVPPIGIGRGGRSCRVGGSLWAVEKTLVCCYSFGTRTTVIDFGFRGTQVVTA